jgi:hypothetical protein
VNRRWVVVNTDSIKRFVVASFVGRHSDSEIPESKAMVRCITVLDRSKPGLNVNINIRESKRRYVRDQFGVHKHSSRVQYEDGDG